MGEAKDNMEKGNIELEGVRQSRGSRNKFLMYGGICLCLTVVALIIYLI